MKLARLVPLALAISSAALAAAPATAESGQRRSPAHRGITSVVRALDINHDGIISLPEIREAAASLRLLDTDADGTLSFAELHPGLAGDAAPAESPAAGAASIDPVLRLLDADENGELSPYEILAAKSRLLALDANDDGKLARDETRLLPAE